MQLKHKCVEADLDMSRIFANRILQERVKERKLSEQNKAMNTDYIFVAKRFGSISYKRAESESLLHVDSQLLFGKPVNYTKQW